MPEAEERETLPGEPTVPYTPTFDTGGFESQPEPPPVALETPPSEPIPVPAQPVVVPGSYHYLKRWTFVLVVLGVSIVAAAIGLGLYYWWYQSVDKTPPDVARRVRGVAQGRSSLKSPSISLIADQGAGSR
ncbi:MAG TPA: hypothetical protein VE623_12715 [Acidimicrobiales bacterium]|nr:hypothetical protein [Acidimicrobiales bacterium]